MSTSQSESKAHNDAVAKAEGKAQAVILPANPTTLTVANPPPTQVVVTAAAVVFHTAVIASAVANGVNPTMARFALMELGQPPK